MKSHPIRIAAILILPAVALAFALTAQGQPEAAGRTWTVDPVHSSVVFRIKHMNTTFFYGTFNEIAGTITTGDNPAFQFTVPIESIDTRHPDRDEHVKQPMFFDSKTFPTLSFQSTAVHAHGDEYHVTGDLTVHGVTKPIEVTVNKIGEASHPEMGEIIGFETIFTIKRSDYGMDQMLDALGDEVTLMIGLEAQGAQ